MGHRRSSLLGGQVRTEAVALTLPATHLIQQEVPWAPSPDEPQNPTMSHYPPGLKGPQLSLSDTARTP